MIENLLEGVEKLRATLDDKSYRETCDWMADVGEAARELIDILDPMLYQPRIYLINDEQIPLIDAQNEIANCHAREDELRRAWEWMVADQSAPDMPMRMGQAVGAIVRASQGRLLHAKETPKP